MAGGVMTTDQLKNRTPLRLRNEKLPRNRGQDSIRLKPDAADLMRHALITTGSLGADAPPEIQ